MRQYDSNLAGTAQNMRFREFSGIDLRPDIIEDSAGLRTRVGSYMINRLAPAMFRQSSIARVSINFQVDPEIRDYFTMPMGTIVCATGFPTISTNNSIMQALASFGINATGDILVGMDRSSLPITLRADYGWFNYERGLMGLFDICPGDTTGTANPVEMPYTAFDADAETLQVNHTTGAPILSGSNAQIVVPYNPATPAAMTVGVNWHGLYPLWGSRPRQPYGIVVGDIPMDIEGRHLNYSQQGPKGYAIMQWGRIRIPFIYNNRVVNGTAVNMRMGGATPGGYAALATTIQDFNANTDAQVLYGAVAVNGAATVNADAYRAIRGAHQFLLLDQVLLNTISGATPDAFQWTNMKLTANRDGKFITQPQQQWSDFNVGRLEVLESRFPKNLNETVLTYPGSETTGTETGGLDQYLYRIIKTVLLANVGNLIGATPFETIYPADAVGCVKAVQDGLFGYAHIFVDCTSAI